MQKGGAYRDKSEHYGLWVYLNHFYHNEPPCPQNANLGSAHFTRELSEYLKKKGQKEAMKEYGWTVDKFREIFGKSWL